MSELVLGIDVGGTGIKGALVDLKTGTLASERIKIATPQPSKPKSIRDTVFELIDRFEYKGIVGCGFPAIVRNGVALSAANIHDDNIGVDFQKVLSEKKGIRTAVVNDADAAGLAEMRFGQGKNQKGVVLLITIGTGLGSGFFVDGTLVPNSEFGHVYLKGHHKIAEKYAANSVRESEDLSWHEWGQRFNEYLHHISRISTVDLFILGGGISKKFHKFESEFDLEARVVPATLINNAGIIGAALYAKENLK